MTLPATMRAVLLTGNGGFEKLELRDDGPVPQPGLFGPEHFDAAVDVVGGAGCASILNCLKRGGRYGVAGAISGPIVDLDLRTLYLKDLRLLGCTILEPEVFPNLVGYIERGEIEPLVAAPYLLAQIVAAQEAFLGKRLSGSLYWWGRVGVAGARFDPLRTFARSALSDCFASITKSLLRLQRSQRRS